jgi:ATP synthase F1 delta subunit
MISATSVAGRYAVALFNAASNQGALAQTLAECEIMRGLLSNRNSYRALFIRILQERTPGMEEIRAGFQPFFVNFMQLIAKNQRIDLFKDIDRIFSTLVDKALSRISITVCTAEDVTEEYKMDIEQKLKVLFDKTLIVTYKVVPHLLGGLLVQSDTLTIDVSVKHQIEKFSKEALSYVANGECNEIQSC